MGDTVSIAAVILGVFLELLAVVGLARLMDAQIPKSTCLVCAAGLGTLLLALLPGLVAAHGILALVQWLNWRDDSRLPPGSGPA
jgi:hypothetical protein